MSKNRPAYNLVRSVLSSCGLTPLQAAEVVKALDAAGLVVMPIEPTLQLLDASLSAMRLSRRIVHVEGRSRDAAQKIKHEIRYRAMVERQREALGVMPQSGVANASAERAITALTTGRDGRHAPTQRPDFKD